MTCEKRSFNTGVKEWLDYDSWEWMCDYITTMYTRTNVKRIDYVCQFTTGCTTAVVQLVVKLLVQSVVNTAGWTMQMCPTKRHLSGPARTRSKVAVDVARLIEIFLQRILIYLFIYCYPR